ncbi:unnamed protein product [Rotaria magnacalcarata]|uniref:TRPM SLOG domain-containing protein n=1 Tax=Rotaria magnacalcarata TaxID=392030 RepID=A0A8S2KMP6_9BILA|nr:unnamed protein product [Rotaria magnacalcarata]
MSKSTDPHPLSNDSVVWTSAIDRLSFQKRICTTFIPKETDGECCVCNYDHSESETSPLIKTWNLESHTKNESTKCYGILPQSKLPYLRCDIKTELDQICLVLLGVWDIPVPGFIMRMISDADTTPNIKMEKELLQSISEAAVVSDAWIITSGYKEESISELVGEMVYKSRIKNPEISVSAIAVGKWGNIHDCHKIEERSPFNQSASYKGHGRYKLELNHTHYIFFDDGTCDSLDNGEFASNLAREISYGARRRIPLTSIVIGGTLHAVSSIFTDLQKQIPVVIVEGSGQIADLLCKYLKLTESSYKSFEIENQQTNATDEESIDHDDDMNITMIDEEFLQDDAGNSSSVNKITLREALRPLGRKRVEFANDVRKLYSNIRQEEYETKGKRLPVGELLSLDEEKSLGQYLFKLSRCITTTLRENIYTFNINTSKSLKETIYHAFIQARNNLSRTKTSHTTADDHVHLALRWNVADATDSQSATSSRIWNDSTKMAQNRLLLINALSKNLIVFIRNFVKLDIDITVLLGPDKYASRIINNSWSRNRQYLKELYSETRRKNRDPLYLLDQISRKLNIKEEMHLSTVLKILVGDFMDPLYENRTKNLGSTRLKTDENANIEKLDAEHIYRDLFLWCILTYRLEMAKIFLSQMKTRICSALVASKILKSFISYAPDKVSKEILLSKAADFEMYAIEFVRCSYFYDKYQTCELIMRRVDLYGGTTCLQMAIAANNKKFIHEDACQALLTNIWYDKLDPGREKTRLILNILTFGIWQIFASLYEKHFSKPSAKTQAADIVTSVPPQQRYYMLYAFDPPSKDTLAIHWTEILTIIIVTTMLLEEIRQWCWKIVYRNCLAKTKFHDNESKCFKMIPADDAVDYAWSEFERYSTNDYIRQLLDAQTTILANVMTSSIPTESSSSSAADSNYAKSDLNDLQDNVERSHNETTERLESMENAITELQSKIVQMEERTNSQLKNRKYVNKALDWIMQAMANAKMSELIPPWIGSNSSRSNSISQRQQNDVQDVQSNLPTTTVDSRAQQIPQQQVRPAASSEFCIEIRSLSFDDDSV